MRCRHCNVILAQSRGLIDGEFCCDHHRLAYEQERAPEVYHSTSLPQQLSEHISAAFHALEQRFARKPSAPVESEFIPPPDIPEAEYDEFEINDLAASETVEHEAYESETYAAAYEAEPTVEPFAETNAAEAYTAESPAFESAPEFQAEADEGLADEATADSTHASPHSARETAASWRWIVAAWKSSPGDLKLIGLAIPVLLFIAVTGTIPRVPIREFAPRSLDQAQGQFQQVVQDHWKNLNESISDRAAVAFADDFRAGLDAWDSHANLTRTWSYDATGFVRPGPLAIFKPTVTLTDYHFDFLEEIDQKAMGWVVRAQDLNNYYAMKLVVVKPGPLPLVHMVRYAVIGGKEGPRVDKPLPLNVRADMLYRIQVTARGGDFTIMVQGQVVDFWSDNRLQHGGIGFFCNRGERARLRWVEVSHQYDALGRLCAYLAPYGIEGRNGNMN
jgi:hypothetical protein